jgi:hypothetical protein
MAAMQIVQRNIPPHSHGCRKTAELVKVAKHGHLSQAAGNTSKMMENG